MNNGKGLEMVTTQEGNEVCPLHAPAVSLRWISETFSLWSPGKPGTDKDHSQGTSKPLWESHGSLLLSRSNHPEQACTPFCRRPDRKYSTVTVAALDYMQMEGRGYPNKTFMDAEI